MNDQSNEITIIDEDYIKSFCFRNTSDVTLKDAAERCFPKDSVWVNLATLKAGMEKFSSLWGFQYSRDGRKLICNRNTNKRVKKCEVIEDHQEGIPDSKASRRSTSIKVGCDFHLCFRVNSKSGIVTVNGGNYQHSEELGCIPSPTNLILVRKASGWYSKLQQPAMDRLLSFMQYGKVTPFTLRKLFQDFLPGNVPIDAQFIVNMRMKAKKHLPKWLELGRILEEDLNNMDDYEGLDDDVELSHDKATIEARHIMYDILNENSNHNAISKYMSSLHEKEASFLYDTAVDKDNTLVGVIWQTAAMRGMFEDYGDVLFTDVMKRNFNAIHWPYISFTVLDSEKKLHVVIEGLICGEYLSGYTWVLMKLFDFSPKRSKELVTIIFADQFFSESVLDSIGFQNPPLIGMDYWHLLESSLPKLFGRHRGRDHWNELKPLLTGMINADSQAEFNFFLEEAQELLRPSPTLLQRLHKFAKEKHRYSKFELFKIPGGLKRRGSVVAEQNHSSIIRRLDTVYNDTPVQLICKLIERQSDIVKEKNYSLSKYAFKVNTSKLERKQAKKKRTSTIQEIFPTIMLEDARESLCYWGYELFLAEYTASFFYIVELVEEGSLESKVTRRGTSTETFRLLSNTKRCDCQDRVSMLIMCRHEIAYHKMFKIDFFSSRWKFVTGVRCEALPQNEGRLYRLQDGENLIAGETYYMEESIRATNNTKELISVETEQGYTTPDCIPTPSVSLPYRSNIIAKAQVPEYKDFMNQMETIFELTKGNRDIRSVVFGALEEIRNSLSSGNSSQQMAGLQQYKNNTQDFFSLFHQTETMKTSNATVPLLPKTPTFTTSVTPNDPSALPSPDKPSNKRILSFSEKFKRALPEKRISGTTTFQSTRPTDEAATLLTKEVSKKQPSCGFCKNIGHRNSASVPCPKMQKWGTTITENTTETIEKWCNKYAKSKKLDFMPLQDLCTKTMCHVVVTDIVLDPSTTRQYAIIVPLTKDLQEIDAYKNKAVSVAALCTWRNKANKKTSMLINGLYKKRLQETMQARKKEPFQPSTTSVEGQFVDRENTIDIPTFMDKLCLELYTAEVEKKQPIADIVESQEWYDNLTAEERQLIDEQVDSVFHEGVQLAKKKKKREAEKIQLSMEKIKNRVTFQPGDTVMYSLHRNPTDFGNFSFEKIRKIVQPTEENDTAFIFTESSHALGFFDCVRKVEDNEIVTDWIRLDEWESGEVFGLVIGEIDLGKSYNAQKFGNYGDLQKGNLSDALTKKY